MNVIDNPTSDRRAHWNAAYAARGPEAVSWFDRDASESLAALVPLLAPGDPVLDVGGGASDLAARLTEGGLGPVTVLDLSETALGLARARARATAARIAWIQGDVTRWSPPHPVALWHDRAVFHFLTQPEDRAAYLATLAAALRPGGHAILSTFAEDGPDRCSGLPVVRYAPDALAAAIAAIAPGLLRPVAATRHLHRTPTGVGQRFQTSIFQRAA
jgi:2-polyprenyl-3-methyl-5-hydroxy-6-metoxy-1,4-benzoquinol methylase